MTVTELLDNLLRLERDGYGNDKVEFVNGEIKCDVNYVSLRDTIILSDEINYGTILG